MKIRKYSSFTSWADLDRADRLQKPGKSYFYMMMQAEHNLSSFFKSSRVIQEFYGQEGNLPIKINKANLGICLRA